jgi:hypothetical protein
MNIDMQKKNKTGPLSLTTCKNQLKMIKDSNLRAETTKISN